MCTMQVPSYNFFFMHRAKRCYNFLARGMLLDHFQLQFLLALSERIQVQLEIMM